MYAVVSTGGKQLKVEKGAEVVVEKVDAAVGDSVDLKVLFAADGHDVYAGPEACESASVTAKVVEHFAGDKVLVFKFKKRKGYKRLKGHRQLRSRLLVTDISLQAGGKPKVASAKKTSEPAIKVDAEGLCCATKSSGEACTNKAKAGSEYCGVHSKKVSE